MAINLFDATYVPTIFIRRAELLAVAELPEATKDNLTPIFCLKPWATSKHLEKSIEKIEDVYGQERQYFLDVDPFYQVEEVSRPAQSEFLELIDDEGGNQNWIDFFSEHPNAFPCILVGHGDADAVRNQTAQFTDMERTFLVRLRFSEFVGRDWGQIVSAVCETEHTNFGFVVDLEWDTDILSRVEWADRVVKRIVDLKGDSIPIVLSGSSFPNNFSKFEDGGTAELFERAAFDTLLANNNRARLVYGDWASSRSPTESRPNPNPIPPRIDLPCSASWEIFRVRDEDGGFSVAATRAMRSPEYPTGLEIWGTYAIEATAHPETPQNDPNLISHHSKAAAVRINLHLYRQQNFNSFDPAPDTDDDFIE